MRWGGGWGSCMERALGESGMGKGSLLSRAPGLLGRAGEELRTMPTGLAWHAFGSLTRT